MQDDFQRGRLTNQERNRWRGVRRQTERRQATDGEAAGYRWGGKATDENQDVKHRKQINRRGGGRACM